MTAKVPISETGTSIMGRIMAFHSCRNSRTTTPTSTTARNRVLTTSATDSRTYGVVSYPMLYLTQGGKVAASLSAAAGLSAPRRAAAGRTAARHAARPAAADRLAGGQTAQHAAARWSRLASGTRRAPGGRGAGGRRLAPSRGRWAGGVPGD